MTAEDIQKLVERAQALSAISDAPLGDSFKVLWLKSGKRWSQVVLAELTCVAGFYDYIRKQEDSR